MSQRLISWKEYDHFQGRDFLTLGDYSMEEIAQLLDLASRLKELQRAGKAERPLEGKSLGLIFEKSSTRTRVSFEVGMYQLGGQAIFLSSNDLQMGRGEPIADTSRVLSRYLHGIMIRTFGHPIVVEMARHATIPVINGLTDDYHPCQVLADLLTILERKGSLQGLKLAYVGDGNNMAHSLLQGCSIMGMDVAIASPQGYEVKRDVAQLAEEQAKRSGAQVLLTFDPREAVEEADIVYTDVWASMGQEEEHRERLEAFRGLQVDNALLSGAKRDCIFMHCLPAHRGEEVAEEVVDGPHSVIFDQAENRLHAQKAVLAVLMHPQQ